MSRRIIPEVPGYNKIDVIAFVQMKIRSNSIWARKACETLYDNQTDLEKRNHLSHGHNNVGFGRNDSPILTKIAAKIKQHRETQKDLERLQRMLPRYARQLICISYDKDGYKSLKKHLDIYYKDSYSKMPY